MYSAANYSLPWLHYYDTVFEIFSNDIGRRLSNRLKSMDYSVQQTDEESFKLFMKI